LASDSSEEEAAVAFALRVADGLDALDDAGRQELLRRVVREVVVHRDRIIVRMVLPTGGGSGGGDGMGQVVPPGQLRTSHFDQVGRAQDIEQFTRRLRPLQARVSATPSRKLYSPPWPPSTRHYGTQARAAGREEGSR